MIITDIQTYILKVPLKQPFYSASMKFDHRSALIVKIITDSGLVGWGEAGQFGPPELPKSVIDYILKPILLGKDPLNNEKLWDDMYNHTRDYGQKGSVIEGISGVDIALWDIKGKALNLPVSILLGGRYREKVQAYATGLYFKQGSEIKDSLNEAAKYIAKGFKGIKVKIGSNTPSEDLDIIKNIRAQFGDDLLIMVDANHGYNSNTAVKIGKSLEDYDVYWFEEPVIPEDIDGYLEVKSRLNLAIAGGECEFTHYGFKNLIARHALDIAQPDVCVTGGFTACRKIISMANVFGVHVVPHVWGSAVAMYAALQLIASIPYQPQTNTPRPGQNDTLFEFDQSENPLREEFVNNTVKLEDGFVHISKQPGIGVEIDEDRMSRYII